jgi:hypothetical protein
METGDVSQRQQRNCGLCVLGAIQGITRRFVGILNGGTSFADSIRNSNKNKP